MDESYEIKYLSSNGQLAYRAIQKILDGCPVSEIRRIIRVLEYSLESDSKYHLPTEPHVTAAECQTMIDVAVKNNCSPEKISEVINRNLAEIADKIAGELAANLAKPKS